MNRKTIEVYLRLLLMFSLHFVNFEQLVRFLIICTYMYMTYNNYYLGDVCEPHKLYRIGRGITL